MTGPQTRCPIAAARRKWGAPKESAAPDESNRTVIAYDDGMADSDSRTLMLVGAINAFREHGIATTSLTEIVERSGAPRGSVYHYFPEGKGQLAGEAVAYFGRGISAAISSMIAQSSPPEIIDAVVTIFRNSLVESNFTSSCPVAAAASRARRHRPRLLQPANPSLRGNRSSHRSSGSRDSRPRLQHSGQPS